MLFACWVRRWEGALEVAAEASSVVGLGYLLGVWRGIFGCG